MVAFSPSHSSGDPKLLAGAAAYLFWPVSANALVSHPNPAASYAEAVQRVTQIQAQETNGYNPLCKAQLLTHGQKAARVVILAASTLGLWLTGRRSAARNQHFNRRV